MSTYKHLLGTPLDRHQSKNKNHNSNAYAFTPIGQQDSDLEFSILNTGAKNRSAHLLNTVSKIKSGISGNKASEQSVLNDTFDTFSTSTPLISFSNNGHNKDDFNAGSAKSDKYNDLLKHSSNPLRHQQDAVEQLKKENLGLKVRIAAFQQYQKANTPEDIIKLINENGELKTDILQMNLQIDKLTGLVNQYKSAANVSSSTSSSATLNNSNSINEQLQSLTSEKRDLLHKVEILQDLNETLKVEKNSLQRKIEELNDLHENENVNGPEESPSFSRHETSTVKSLKSQLEDLQSELRNQNRKIEEKELQIERLQKKCQRLEEMKTQDLEENDQLEEALIDKNEAIKELKQEIANKNQDIDKLATTVHDIKVNLNNKDSKIDSLNNKLIKRDTENSNLKVKLKSLEGTGNSSSKKLEKIMKDAQEKSDKIKQLNSDIHEYERRLTLSQDEVEKLASYTESLKSQLSAASRSSYSNNYELEDEILRLRGIENNLRSEVSHYKLRVTELEANLEEQQGYNDLNNTTFLKNVAQVEIERDQAYEDLKVYEDHIMDLENRLDDALLSIETLQTQHRQSNAEIIDLKTQNDSLRRQVQTSSSVRFAPDRSQNKDNNKKASTRGFFSSFWNGPTDVDTDEDDKEAVSSSTKTFQSDTNIIKKLTREKEDLKDEIKGLKLKISHLTEDLDSERLSKSNSTYEKEEIKRMSKRNNDLEVLIENKNASFESTLNDYKLRISKLMEELNMKESEISQLKAKSKHEVEAINKEDHIKLFKENIEKEKENAILTREKEVQRQNFESKIKILHDEIDKLKRTPGEDSNNTIKDLEQKIKENSRLNDRIITIEESKNDLYHAMKVKQDQLTEKLAAADKELQKVKENYKKVYKRYKALQSANNDNSGDLSELSFLSSVYGEHEKFDQLSSKSDLQLKQKLTAKEKELKILSEEYGSMRQDLMSRLKEMHASKKSLNAKVTDLTKQVEEMNINKDDVVATVKKEYDMEKENDLLASHNKQLNLLENKVRYYRERFHKEIYLAQDLKFMNNYILSSIKKSDKMIMSDINKLAKVGVYPDYKLLNKKKLTFKVIAKAVLAAVRMKNRLQKSEQKLKSLRGIQLDLKTF